MNRSIYCNPKLYIDDIIINSSFEVSFSDSMASLSRLSISIKATHNEQFTDFFNKKVEFYLNYGGIDGAPLFRGLVKEFTINSDNISIQAIDVRTLLTGSGSIPIIVDNKKNYDGQTVMQFLIDIVDNKINQPSLISSEYTNDTDKPVFMTGYRGIVTSPYETIKPLIGEHLDDDDLSLIGEYFLDVFHGGETSSIIVNKLRQIDINNFDMSFSEYDGLIEFSYKDRPSPSYITGKTITNEEVVVEYGNSPRGKVGIQASGSYSSRGEAAEKILPHLLANQDAEKDISITTSKGHYLSIGNIIRIESKDDALRGQYRITSKNISYNNSGVSCNFQLNKKPEKLSNFLNLSVS